MREPQTSSNPDALSRKRLKVLSRELEIIAKSPPGWKTVKEAITELLPEIQGCRKRGHAWKTIAKLFQEEIPSLTTAAFRKTVLALDPSLKASAKKKSVPVVAVAELPLDREPLAVVTKELAQVSRSGVGFAALARPKKQVRRKTPHRKSRRTTH